MSAQKFIKKKTKTGEKKLKPTKPVEAIVEAKKEQKEEIIIPPGKMKICVIGLGATGGLIAAYLKSKRRQVTAVGDMEEKKVIRSNGLKAEGPKDTAFVELDVQVEMKYRPDLVILAVNTQDISQTINQNRKFLTDTLILSTQNNIRTDQIISLVLGKENIIASIVIFDSIYLKPGLIKHDFEGDWIIGNPFGANDDRVKEVAEELAPAFKVTIADDITSMKWLKLIVEATYCIPALLGKSIQEAFSNLDMAYIGVLFLKECFAVVDDAKIKLADLPNFELAKLRQIASMPDQEASQAFSELLVNLPKKSQDKSVLDRENLKYLSEMDYINGEIIRLGRFGKVGAQLNAKAVNFAKKVKTTNTFFNFEEIKQIFIRN